MAVKEFSPEQRLAAYEYAFGSYTAQELEWSGTLRGPGFGPMGSGPGGTEYPACPCCRQLESPNGDFLDSAVGHLHSCRLAKLLGSSRNPPKPEEQEEMF